MTDPTRTVDLDDLVAALVKRIAPDPNAHDWQPVDPYRVGAMYEPGSRFPDYLLMACSHCGRARRALIEKL